MIEQDEAKHAAFMADAKAKQGWYRFSRLMWRKLPRDKYQIAEGKHKAKPDPTRPIDDGFDDVIVIAGVEYVPRRAE
jgi:hypothetical protein